MHRTCTLVAIAFWVAASATAFAQLNAVPFEFDPSKSNLVAAEWKGGIGCPTNVSAQAFDAGGNLVSITVTDPACAVADSQDKFVTGLLLAKSGPTPVNASAGARITGVKGTTLTELGYDIRKPSPDGFAGPRGSHCGAGAPRFNVVTTDGVTHFVGCASPPPVDTPGQAWQRLRWGAAQLAAAFPPITPADTVDSIAIVFDEGPDTGPDNFGLAVIDNIDINGTLIGNGPRGPAK